MSYMYNKFLPGSGKYTISRSASMIVNFLLLFSYLALCGSAYAEENVHKILLQISTNDAARMNLILNNASNINKYYLDKGEEAQIEIVAYGPGLTMLRGDKSPVKKRIKTIAQNYENVSFKACNNTLHKAMKKEKKKHIPLVPEAKIVPSGVIHLIQRQEQGWHYIKP